MPRHQWTKDQGPQEFVHFNDFDESGTKVKNTTGIALGTPELTWDDATWILTSAFIIFTMQSGFGLLEAGNVSAKNEVNIMVKNVIDVIFGGLTYWMFGFGLSYGEEAGSNAFCGVGHFFLDVDNDNMGVVYSTFVFQLSFATTATTIVSGAMAERTKLTSYLVFSFFNTVVYCIPAHWAWAKNGFINQLGGIDFAGSGVVHMVGGVSGLVATIMLKPRVGRFDVDAPKPPMCNPANAIVGMFMLWWGWLAFNCGSTFGISNGKWKLAAKTAVTTLLASMSGGIIGTFVSFFTQKKKFDIGYLVNSILGALVSVTASCPLVRPWESIVIGAVGGFITIGTDILLDKIKVDDPVSAVAVHGASGTWGLLAVGIFAADDRLENLTQGRNGLIHGGGFYMLGVQLLTIVCEMTWSASSTFLILYPIHKSMGLRMSEEDEILGADITEHNVVKGDFTSQLTFTSQNDARRPMTTVNPIVATIHSHVEDADDKDKKKWKRDRINLNSLANMNGNVRRSSLSWLSHDNRQAVRDVPNHEHLAHAFPA
ncbi:hypothetical protein BsWGS_01026 [Bradybaena similaris]